MILRLNWPELCNGEVKETSAGSQESRWRSLEIPQRTFNSDGFQKSGWETPSPASPSRSNTRRSASHLGAGEGGGLLLFEPFVEYLFFTLIKRRQIICSAEAFASFSSFICLLIILCVCSRPRLFNKLTDSVHLHACVCVSVCASVCVRVSDYGEAAPLNCICSASFNGK